MQSDSVACVDELAEVELTPFFYDACRLLRDSGTVGVSSAPVAAEAATLDVTKNGPNEYAAAIP